MSSKSVEDENTLSKDLNDGECLRKTRTDNASRKSWSFTDRRTDQEVLREMGVSFLEPDDTDLQNDTENSSNLPKPNLKRKRDIENVNPNANCGPARGRVSPKSPCGKYSPIAGPARVRSPRSGEKLKPLQPTDQQVLETTMLDQYYIDEETPLAQCVSAQYHEFNAGPCSNVKRQRLMQDGLKIPMGLVEEIKLFHEPEGPDPFLRLSDEMMLFIFKWLPKRTLTHCMLVNKRWYRMASDESLWWRLELGNKTVSKGAIEKILSRKCIIVRLASSEIGEWHPTTSPSPSRIQYLDLSMCTIDPLTLDNLLCRCPELIKLSVEGIALTDSTCAIIGKCSKLETLNLTMTQGVTETGLESILDGCARLQSLNVSWCGLDESALQVLTLKLPETLQRLNVAGARVMTDEMVVKLCVRCPRLLELDCSDCSKLEAPSILAVLKLTRLEHLALSRCYYVPFNALTKLSSMPALRYLEVWAMLSSNALAALRVALPAIQINQFMLSAIARPTVGNRRTSIWGLRTRD